MDKALVECYSGAEYAERPTALFWQGQRLLVAEIEHQWREPGGPTFRVRSVDGQRFQVHYDERADAWAILLLETMEDRPR